jgi:hypothetical protein
LPPVSSEQFASLQQWPGVAWVQAGDVPRIPRRADENLCMATQVEGEGRVSEAAARAAVCRQIADVRDGDLLDCCGVIGPVCRRRRAS